MELAISGYFCIEIGFNFYFYEGRKYNFFLSIDTWIDLLTVLPEIIPLFLRSGSNNSVSFLRILRVFKIMRVIKFRKTLKKMNLSKREKELELNVESISRLNRQLIFLVISLFAALFISAGIITFVQDVFSESMNEKLKFFDSFYFVVITATTIGYGDIYPLKTESRIIITFMIVIIFAIFGDQISKIIMILRESDKYDIKYHLSGHTIIFNNKSIVVLTSFLKDHFSSEEEEARKVLVVDDVCMEKEMKRIMHLEYFEGRVLFLSMRNGVTSKVLIKSGVRSAKNIFLISDPFSTNGDQQDK